MTSSDDEIFQIEALLRYSAKTQRFLVSWEGYPASDNSWEPSANLPAHLVSAWFVQNKKPTKRKRSSSTARQRQRQRQRRPPATPQRASTTVRFACAAPQENVVPNWDRSPVVPDVVTCDVCGSGIAAGLQGFDVFATCALESCEDGGFDVCAACSGMPARSTTSSDAEKPSAAKRKFLRLTHHRHRLMVVDRGAEVRWASSASSVVRRL